MGVMRQRAVELALELERVDSEGGFDCGIAVATRGNAVRRREKRVVLPMVGVEGRMADIFEVKKVKVAIDL